MDIFGNGFHLTDIEQGVKFRVLPDQGLRQMSWPEAWLRNGWLALDRNGDGRITDFTELFGNATPQPKGSDRNGYKALAVFDEPANGRNGNGVIDPGDAVFDHLLIWIDDNHNGISEPNELYSLRDAVIFRIDLRYFLSNRIDENGNCSAMRLKFGTKPGMIVKCAMTFT
jgi:hypothetical protein